MNTTDDATLGDIVPFSLLRLESLLAGELSETLHGLDVAPSIAVRLIDDEGTATELPQAYFETLAGKVGDALREFESSHNDSDIIATPAPNTIHATLRCQHCAHVSHGEEVVCETYLDSVVRREPITLGDKIDVGVLSQSSPFYVRFQNDVRSDSTSSSTVHAIEGWECTCCRELNWAEVVVENGTLRSVWSVQLNAELFDRADVISSECVDFAAGLADKAGWMLDEDETVAILRSQFQ